MLKELYLENDILLNSIAYFDCHFAKLFMIQNIYKTFLQILSLNYTKLIRNALIWSNSLYYGGLDRFLL